MLYPYEETCLCFLAHAYSTIGRCPFEGAFDVLIIDGSGSTFSDCIDTGSALIPEREKIHKDVAHLYFEKDSYYNYADEKLIPVYKDFAPQGYQHKAYPAGLHTLHSIGGLSRSQPILF